MAAWRIFAVDDDPLTRRSLETLLGQEPDLETAAFTSVAEFRAAAQAHPPDAVIAEASLAGASGIDLVEAMAASDPDLVSLVVTSASDPDATAQALSRVGPLRLVHKPFKPHDLLPRLRAGLERRALARALAAARGTLAQQSTELATATERLVEAEHFAAVARVLNGIAHEITSQLALVGYAEAIRSKVAGDPELVDLCDVIVSAHKRLCTMIDQVREFVTEPHRAGFPREPADVASVVDEALGILRYDRDVRARNLVKSYRGRPLASLHREKFAQVVINLVSNAVLATRPGDTIEIELDTGADGTVLTVSDRGVGMSPEVLARLGEPFFTTRGDRGSGLGVGICMQIVEEHGGSLTFSSEAGAGTRARVRLPLLEAEGVIPLDPVSRSGGNRSGGKATP